MRSDWCAAAEREAGHERADDRRELRDVGQLCESQREGERERRPVSRRIAPVGAPAANSGGASRGRRRPRSPRGTPIASADDADDREDRHRAVGDEPHDDGEDHQAEHVVGHRRAEHGARLGLAERRAGR